MRNACACVLRLLSWNGPIQPRTVVHLKTLWIIRMVWHLRFGCKLQRIRCRRARGFRAQSSRRDPNSPVCGYNIPTPTGRLVEEQRSRFLFCSHYTFRIRIDWNCQKNGLFHVCCTVHLVSEHIHILNDILGHIMRAHSSAQKNE